VDLRRELDWDAFHQALVGARAVLVPLRERVGSSGQMVTLAAMQLGKVTFVPDVDAVAQYLVDGESGIVYPLGDDAALLAALRAHLDDPDRRAAVGRAAAARYRASFTRERFDAAVVSDVLELASAPA
jgi:glycosyltransferase involved in cell wall biosynthesis